MEVILNRPNWIGSEVGLVQKSATVTDSSGTYVLEDGRKKLKSGTLINDTVLGYGLLYQDADVTDGPREVALVVGGRYIDANLPSTVSTYKDTLAAKGLFAIDLGDTTISYGEVSE